VLTPVPDTRNREFIIIFLSTGSIFHYIPNFDLVLINIRDQAGVAYVIFRSRYVQMNFSVYRSLFGIFSKFYFYHYQEGLKAIQVDFEEIEILRNFEVSYVGIFEEYAINPLKSKKFFLLNPKNFSCLL